jgi:hypothetical protein
VGLKSLSFWEEGAEGGREEGGRAGGRRRVGGLEPGGREGGLEGFRAGGVGGGLEGGIGGGRRETGGRKWEGGKRFTTFSSRSAASLKCLYANSNPVKISPQISDFKNSRISWDSNIRAKVGQIVVNSVISKVYKNSVRIFS